MYHLAGFQLSIQYPQFSEKVFTSFPLIIPCIFSFPCHFECKDEPDPGKSLLPA